jgi:site-specific DNA recombinase
MKNEPPERGRAKHVGIWLRVSTEDQAKGESPEHHEKRARAYAESKGWQVREVYHLEAVSGKSVREHPETQRMIADVKRGHISGLIFSKLARLARNTRELLDFADFFQDAGADLVSLEEAIDTSTPAGRLFYTVIAAMAQWEREEISARVAASVPIRAKLGKPLGGAAPFGYQWRGRELAPQPDEAPVRRRIYEMFLNHRRRKTVARLLNEAGHRTRNGSLFTDTTIERLIRDPTAKGVRRANYTKSLGEKKHWKLKPKDEWVLTAVEAIVPTELWEQCNQILDERRKNGKIPARRAVQLFAGVAVCHCGNKMYVPSNTPKYVCYRCRNKIPVNDLEAVFHEQLKEFVFSPKEVAAYLVQADEKMWKKQALLETLEDDRRKVRSEMDRVMRLYLDEKISADGFASEYTPLEARFKQLSDQLPEIQGDLDFLKIRALSGDEILAEARDLYSRWSDLSRDEKRKIIETVAEKITVGKDDVTIDLCYLPSPSEVMAEEQRNLRGSSPPPASRWREKSWCPSRGRS